MKMTKGFTLLEILVVIAVIAILATLTIVGTANARRKAKEVILKQQMVQIAESIIGYRDTNESHYPNRLSHLFPSFMNDPRALLDPMDASQGKEGCKPDFAMQQYYELDEGPEDVNGDQLDMYYPNTIFPQQIWPCSFVYPFANVPIDPGFQNYLSASEDALDRLDEPIPGGGTISWKEGKLYQLRYGDGWSKGQHLKGYPDDWFPMIRSFWHMKDPDDSSEKKVAVVSVSGKFWWSTPKWENDILEMEGYQTNP